MLCIFFRLVKKNYTCRVGEDDKECFKENDLKNLGTDFFSFEEEIS